MARTYVRLFLCRRMRRVHITPPRLEASAASQMCWKQEQQNTPRDKTLGVCKTVLCIFRGTAA